MARNNTNDSQYDYDQDYQRAARDYAEMGPLWAELVFPDDFEAMKALYGQRHNQNGSQPDNNSNYKDDRNHRRR